MLGQHSATASCRPTISTQSQATMWPVVERTNLRLPSPPLRDEAPALASRPHHGIRALKAGALLFGSGSGRGFGSVFHHQYPKANRSRLAFFHARNASIGAVSGRRLADAHAVWAPFPPRQRLSVLGFSLRPVVGTRGHLLV